MNLLFEWDEKKEKENIRKHRISFEEAKTIFNDPFSITIHDPKHSINEARFIDIGLSTKENILIVVYTERKKVIRIISSRLATKKEQKEYEENSI